MICERCGEIAETFYTEQYGELCEACQKQAEQENMKSPPPKRRLFDEAG
jgi:hypothetical protein